MPPPSGAPRDQTAMPQFLAVMHTLVKDDTKEVHLMSMPISKPILYDCLPIGKLMQPDQPPPYTQFQAEGQYYYNTPNQQGQTYRGG